MLTKWPEQPHDDMMPYSGLWWGLVGNYFWKTARLVLNSIRHLRPKIFTSGLSLRLNDRGKKKYMTASLFLEYMLLCSYFATFRTQRKYKLVKSTLKILWKPILKLTTHETDETTDETIILLPQFYRIVSHITYH